MTNLLILSISLVTNTSHQSWYEPMSDAWKDKTNKQASEATNGYTYYDYKRLGSNYAASVYNPYRSCSVPVITRTIQIGQQVGTNITKLGELETKEVQECNHHHITQQEFQQMRMISDMEMNRIMLDVVAIGLSNTVKTLKQ